MIHTVTHCLTCSLRRIDPHSICEQQVEKKLRGDELTMQTKAEPKTVNAPFVMIALVAAGTLNCRLVIKPRQKLNTNWNLRVVPFSPPGPYLLRCELQDGCEGRVLRDIEPFKTGTARLYLRSMMTKGKRVTKA